MSSEVMLFSPLYLPDGSTNHQLIRIKFYSSWHGVSEQYYFQFYSYWQCQKCCLMTFFFLFFFLFLFININRMKSGRIRNEGRKEKMCLQPCTIKGSCNIYEQVMAKTAGRRTQPYWMDASRSLLQTDWKHLRSTSWKI
jgi:hypothetical protein